MRVFKEEQQFTQWWLWLLLTVVTLIPVYGIVQQLFFKIPFGDNPMSNASLLSFLAFTILLNYFFIIIKLETYINEKGIKFRFPPLKRKYKSIKWEEISNVFVKKYNPMLDYGGWGIKHGSYSVKGNIGLHIILKSGKKIVIGTQNLIEMESVLKTYKSKTVSNEL